MSQEARGEAKRLRRLKRKLDGSQGKKTNPINATGLTIVGGGALAAIAIGLGVNAFAPGSPNASNEEDSPAPIDSSQSPTPSSSPESSSVPEEPLTNTFKISITASPSASPSYSPSPSMSPTPTGVAQGSYYAEGRYGAGYYSTAYDVAFSSPMFQAGSGSYYGTSGYDAAIDSPNGYYSSSGWSGSGFYASGYFDYSANFAGLWDGSGISYPYGTGAYYGISGFSSAEFELQGSYYASGIAGSGYYASLFTGRYYRVTDSGNAWTEMIVEVGVGTYYGISGTSQPIEAPSGSYYITGFSGAGYYSTGYYACGYGYVTGASEYNFYFGSIGRQTFYGLSPDSTPFAGPEGIYKSDGFKGAGYYEPRDLYDSEWRFGSGTYYGTNGYGSPIAPPTGMQWYYTGWGGVGFYSTGQIGTYWYEGIGTGDYYGTSGTASPLTPA